MQIRLIALDGTTLEKKFARKLIRMGRDPRCEIAFEAATHPKVSALHAQIELSQGQLTLLPMSKTNATLLNETPVAERVVLSAGDRIRLGAAGPVVQILTLPTGVTPIPKLASTSPLNASLASNSTDFGATMMGTDAQINQVSPNLLAQDVRFPVADGKRFGRDRTAADYVLPHPLVSRLHAVIRIVRGVPHIADAGSANGTYLNGARLLGLQPLQTGDRLDIGPFCLEFNGRDLTVSSRSNNVELIAYELGRVVKDRNTGADLSLITNLTLVFKPGDFVAILGPSGSGKSTLLGMLSGRTVPTYGQVIVNHEDLYDNFAALRRDITVVPQKDLLYQNLSVQAALTYTARLRLPSDTSSAEIQDSVDEMIATVQLTHRKDTLIKHLSGGQIKRVSLANELLARPSLIFLDEVTSGLDEQTDQDMMNLFKQIAKSGKTVLCITHNLTNVETTCDLVTILTVGGRLAFLGSPEAAKNYFQVQRLGEVYRVLEGQPAEVWEQRFQTHPLYQRYINNRLPQSTQTAITSARRGSSRHSTLWDGFSQTWILSQRYWASWWQDKVALVTLLLQAIFVAALLALVFGEVKKNEQGHVDLGARYLVFLTGVACFWFGANVAAKELVKEREIFNRERDYNLRNDSYLWSKFGVLTLLSFIQTISLFTIVHIACAPIADYWNYLFILLLMSFGGVCAGLAISALSNSEEVAIGLVPILVIPQIILGGVVAKLENVAEVLGQFFCYVYWGQRALDEQLQVPEQQSKFWAQALQIDIAPCSLPTVVVICGLFCIFFTSTAYAILLLRAQRR